MIDINHLRTFVTIVREGSLSGAGRVLGFTQPAISKHLSVLENFFGARLLNRDIKGARLTAEGEVLYGYAESILDLLDKAQQDIEAISNAVKGKVVIAASTVPGQYVLPQLLSGFRNACPEVDIIIEIGDTEWVLDRLARSEVELGAVGSIESSGDWSVFKLAEDELVVIVPPNHPFSTRREVSVGEFLNERLVWREKGSGTRRFVEGKLKMAGVDLQTIKICSEMGSTEAVVGAVKGGLGISIVSRRAVEEELVLGTLAGVYLEGISLRRDLYLVHKKDKRLRPAERKLLAFLKEDLCLS